MAFSDRGIVFRKTTESDLPQIYSDGINELNFKKIYQPFNAENLAGLFASENSVCLTAVRKKKVLGFMLGSIESKKSSIYWFMVKERYRKTGIGKELLKLFMEVSKKRGAEKFFIAVPQSNDESFNFFTGNEFFEAETYKVLHKNINEEQAEE